MFPQTQNGRRSRERHRAGEATRRVVTTALGAGAWTTLFYGVGNHHCFAGLLPQPTASARILPARPRFHHRLGSPTRAPRSSRRLGFSPGGFRDRLRLGRHLSAMRPWLLHGKGPPLNRASTTFTGCVHRHRAVGTVGELSQSSNPTPFENSRWRQTRVVRTGCCRWHL